MKRGTISLMVGLLLCGGLYASRENREPLLFSPAFSDPNFSCRCLPIFDAPIYKSTESLSAVFQIHSKICEYKTYIRSLERHGSFLQDLVSGSESSTQPFFDCGQKSGNKDLRDWFDRKGKEVANQRLEVKKATLKLFERLPFEDMYRQLRTQSMKSALQSLQQTKSFDALLHYWEALQRLAEDTDGGSFQTVFAKDLELTKSLPKNLVAEQEITQAYLLLKDFVDVLVLLYRFIDDVTISDISKRSVLSKNTAPVSAFDVQGLSIADTIAVINKSMQSFVFNIDAAYKEENKKENINFYRWIKEKWAMISLSVGVILINVTHTFPVQNNMLQGKS